MSDSKKDNDILLSDTDTFRHVGSKRKYVTVRPHEMLRRDSFSCKRNSSREQKEYFSPVPSPPHQRLFCHFSLFPRTNLSNDVEWEIIMTHVLKGFKLDISESCWDNSWHLILPLIQVSKVWMRKILTWTNYFVIHERNKKLYLYKTRIPLSIFKGTSIGAIFIEEKIFSHASQDLISQFDVEAVYQTVSTQLETSTKSWSDKTKFKRFYLRVINVELKSCFLNLELIPPCSSLVMELVGSIIFKNLEYFYNVLDSLSIKSGHSIAIDEETDLSILSKRECSKNPFYNMALNLTINPECFDSVIEDQSGVLHSKLRFVNLLENILQPTEMSLHFKCYAPVKFLYIPPYHRSTKLLKLKNVFCIKILDADFKNTNLDPTSYHLYPSFVIQSSNRIEIKKHLKFVPIFELIK
jgi:hypothetical protein